MKDRISNYKNAQLVAKAVTQHKRKDNIYKMQFRH